MLLRKLFLVLFLTFSSFLFAESQLDLIGVGKGVTKKGIIAKASKNAMLKYLKSHFSAFDQHQIALKQHITENWRKYWVRNVKIKKQRDGVFQIKMTVRTKLLLRDIKRIPEIRLASKVAGLTISLLIDPKFASSSFDDVRFMMDQFYDLLGQHFRILDKSASNELFALEKKIFGSDEHNYSDVLWRKFDSVRVNMFFSITREKNNIFIRARGVHRMTGAILFRFSETIVSSNLENGIARCCEKVVNKIVTQMAYRHTIFPENVYYLKFVLLRKKKDVAKVRNALIALKNSKMLKILPGGIGAGKSYILERIRWRKTAFSQFEIIAAIEEYCEVEGLLLACEKYSHNLMVFQPPNSQPKPPKPPEASITNTLFFESEFDRYFEIDSNKYNAKENEHITVKFRWPKHAPKDWYFYCLNLSDRIYLLHPNAEKGDRLLETGKNYSFPDGEDDFDNWGVELKATIPLYANKHSFKLLLLATSTPISFLSKKLAKLKGEKVVLLKAEEVVKIREEVLKKEYAHQIIDVNVTKKKKGREHYLYDVLAKAKKKNNFAVVIGADRGNGGIYYEKDLLTLNWIVSANSYVSIFYKQANGDVIRVFPNEDNVDGYVKKNKLYQIPTEKNNFDLEIDENVGTEEIIIFASKKPTKYVIGKNLGFGILKVKPELVDQIKSEAQAKCRIIVK